MLIGLIGKANVGKSTFFKAATEIDTQCGNYPFTTISPNVGIAYVKVKCVCRELGVQDNPVHSMCIDGNRFIPIKIIDVAGLIPGAHLGKGLGNKFLDDARQADALIHVVDAAGSTDSEGRPVPVGTGDPLSDIDFVEEEFDRWIASIVSRDWNKFVREAENQGLRIEQTLAKRLSGLSIRESHIVSSIAELGLHNKKLNTWSEEDIIGFCKKVRLKSRPIIIAANKADLPSSDSNITRIRNTGRNTVPCSSELEWLLRRASKNNILHYLPGDGCFAIRQGISLTEQQKKALEKSKSLISKYGSTGVQETIRLTCFRLLKLIVVYPVEDEIKLTDKKGNILPDARLLAEDSTPRDLANKIHAELGKGFLYAIDARSKKRLGADYKLKNNDIVKIVSTTRTGG
ncbi:MAG TPA: redox-regulated ATPase YchF [Nitrososphaeraceae archaeon]